VVENTWLRDREGNVHACGKGCMANPGYD